VHEPHLLDRGCGQRERIAVWNPECAIEIVEHVGEWKPAVDQPIERRVGPDRRDRKWSERRFVGAQRTQGDAAGAGSLNGVEDVQIVGPRFGPVFPWVRRGIGADELGLPLLPRSLFVWGGYKEWLVARSSWWWKTIRARDN
jgi:hypothetical protein